MYKIPPADLLQNIDYGSCCGIISFRYIDGNSHFEISLIEVVCARTEIKGIFFGIKEINQVLTLVLLQENLCIAQS